MMPSGEGGFGQLWRWPLYSLKRFFSCIAVVLALVALSNMVLGATHKNAPPQDAVATPSATATTTEPTPTPTDSSISPAPAENGVSTTPVTPTSSPKQGNVQGAKEAGGVALAFTRAWADHGKPAPVWLAGMSKYADPEFAAQLKSIDPANVPASKVTGQPKPTSVFFASASFEVPTDAGPMVVSLLKDEAGTWKVDDIHPK